MHPELILQKHLQLLSLLLLEVEDVLLLLLLKDRYKCQSVQLEMVLKVFCECQKVELIGHKVIRTEFILNLFLTDSPQVFLEFPSKKRLDFIISISQFFIHIFPEVLILPFLNHPFFLCQFFLLILHLVF